MKPPVPSPDLSLYSAARELARSGKRPLEIAAELNIKVMLLPFKGIGGIGLSLGQNRFIFLEASLSEEEQQLVCGHEMGHFFLHPETNFFFILKNTHYYSRLFAA